MGKEKILTTYVVNHLERRRSRDLSAVTYFNDCCLPLLRRVGLFKDQDINAYYGLDANAIYEAFAALKLSACTSEGAKARVRRDLDEDWREFVQHNYIPDFPQVSEEGKQYISYDEKKCAFVLNDEAYTVTAPIVASTPAELKVYDKIIALDKALKALNFDKVSILGLFHPDAAGNINLIGNLTHPGTFAQLVENDDTR